MTAIEFHLPLRLYSTSNRREHWAKRAKRVKRERGIVETLTRHVIAQAGFALGGVVITITRHGPRKLDSDNLATSAKAVRDGIADALFMDDGDDRLDWRYAQVTGKGVKYGVTIRIESAAAEEGKEA